MYKYIDLTTVEAYKGYFETSFFGWGKPSYFNYGHLCTANGRADQNRMAVDVEREGH